MLKLLPALCLAACAASPTPPVGPTSPSAPEPAPDAALAPLRPLLGTWSGDDPDHHTRGGFTMRAELGGKVLVRRSTNAGGDVKHEDLTVVYATPTGLRADYWDNEGHQIAYAVTRTGDHIELVSDAAPDRPRFRLTYDLHGPDACAIDFALSPPGSDQFQHVVGGTVRRQP